jgi:hypothetical protein
MEARGGEQMIRLPLALGFLACVAACGDGNPFDETAPENGDTGTDDRIYATELNDDLTMNALRYDDQGTADPSDDILIVNNLPFDSTDSSGGGYTRQGALAGSEFDVYESPGTGGPSDRRYFAVFRRSALSQTAAVGTGDYEEFGFGGATAQRLQGGSVPNPRAASYTFTGDYAAVRVSTISGGTDDVEFVTGDTTLFVDVQDFDTDGAVEGIVDNRRLYNNKGDFLGTLGDYVSLATASIDFDTAGISQGTASGVEGTNTIASGEWTGIFSGPGGQEIAGIVVLEGSTTSAEPADEVRETGTFIVVNGG